MKNYEKVTAMLFSLFVICSICVFASIVQNLDVGEENYALVSAETRGFSSASVISQAINEFESDSEDKIFNIYYEMLNDTEKRLYNDLCSTIENYKSSITLSYKVTVEEAKNVIEAVYNDHPEYFYINSTFTYSYSDSGLCLSINISYNDLIKSVLTNKKILEQRVQAIKEVAETFSTDYEKEKFVHDLLVNSITYDKNASNNQTAFSALVNGHTVCAGYSKAFQYIMKELGIPTYYVVGYASEAHSWNIVYLDGNYYNVDLTWDDSYNDYSFFNVSDEEISMSHQRQKLSIYLPSCNV